MSIPKMKSWVVGKGLLESCGILCVCVNTISRVSSLILTVTTGSSGEEDLSCTVV